MSRNPVDAPGALPNAAASPPGQSLPKSELPGNGPAAGWFMFGSRLTVLHDGGMR